MKRLLLICLLLAALAPLMSCTDATLVASPRTLRLDVQFNASTPGSFDVIQISWAGSMSNPPTGDPPDAGETTLQNEPLKTINRADQGPTETITRSNLHIGVWQFSLSATGTGTGQTPVTLVSGTCTQEIFRGTTTTISFTEGGNSCTCTAGCTAP